MSNRKPRKQVVDPAMTTLPIGTPVIVTKDDGSEFRTYTRSAPWQLGHGAWVVSVDGISGGYDLERIRKAPTGTCVECRTAQLLKPDGETIATHDFPLGCRSVCRGSGQQQQR